ncbi:MAG: hypothetical protein K6U03_11790, partial [Firmicutes bacterium]|nr:hypothetical protein [Bacillota bacterium]
AQAYRFLRAAKEIRDGWAAMNSARLREARLNKCLAALIETLMGVRGIAERAGRARHLFASALTPDGPKEYLADVFASARSTVVLRGQPGTGKSRLLAGLLGAATARGFYAECFHCGFDPFRLEHLFLPELSAGVVTANEHHGYEPEGAAVIETDAFLEPAPDHLRAMAAEAREVFAELIARAVHYFGLAKEAHDAMESHYVAGMDFAGVERLRAKTLERILSYAERTLSRGRAGESA